MGLSKKNLARVLAVGACQGVWDAEGLEASFRSRLPARFRAAPAHFAQALLGAYPGGVAPTVAQATEVLVAQPGFARLYRHCRKHGVWPAPVLEGAQMRPLPVFAQLDVPQCADVAALADWLGLDDGRLRYLADVDGRYLSEAQGAANHYHYDFLQKKSGGVRVIEAPKPQLKAVQRRILHGILEQVPVHDAAFGFVRGRSCLEGASRHVGEQMVVGFDLADFFPSVAMGRVFGLFRALGYPETVARILTGLCTNRTPPAVVSALGAEVRALYRAPHLPQGAPSSPALANLVAFGLDCRLAGLARGLGLNYSRYADDLAFSGDRRLRALVLRAVPEIVRSQGFALRADKTRVMGRGGRQVVTGIVVNDHLNVPRGAFDQLKAVIHLAGKDGRLRDPMFAARLRGQIGWVAQVNPGRGARLWALWAKAGGELP